MKKAKKWIIFGCIACITAYWLADSLWSFISFERNLETLVFSEPRTLIDTLLLRTTPYQVVSRLTVTIIIVVGAWLLYKYTAIQRKSQETLITSEERFRVLSEESPLGIALINKDGRYEYINPAFVEIFGYSLDDFSTGKEWFELAYPDPEYREYVVRSWLEDLSNQSVDLTRPRTFDVRCKDGNVRSILFRPVTIHTYDQFILYEDITRNLQNEKEKARLQTQLQQAQKMEAIGTLAGGIAHDFNNLLQAINGFTQLLLMDKSSTDPDQARLTAIQEAGQRASKLVRQLLLFSRKAESTQKPVQLPTAVEQARKMLERTIPKMIHMQVNSGNRISPIMADPVQIEQLILNLGSNAADSMPDGGNLLFEIENTFLDEDFVVRHMGAVPGKYVLLTVSDTGEGIDKQNLDKVFEPFFTTKELGKGTGLGLASVYGIVKSHDGYITCYSEVGLGTTFKIYFPALDRADVVDAPQSVDKPMSGGRETILMVDDDEAIRNFAKEAFESFGYTVMTAPCGEEALKIYSEMPDKVDLVVMDLGMPGMGGHKCLLELIQMDKAVKVIIASGYSVSGQLKKSMDAGAKGYVGKPYRLADLLNTVRAVLDEDD